MGQGGSHYVSFVFCPFIHCEDALEHHQSKSSSSMSNSWAIWSLLLVSLRSPLDVPYGAVRSGGGGSGDCEW